MTEKKRELINLLGMSHLVNQIVLSEALNVLCGDDKTCITGTLKRRLYCCGGAMDSIHQGTGTGNVGKYTSLQKPP